jgi:hypothetical protein
MEIGDHRKKFCEDCEAVTEQRLDKLVVLGSGEPGAQLWHCLDGDHSLRDASGGPVAARRAGVAAATRARAALLELRLTPVERR